MAQQSVYDYVTKTSTTIDKHDFEMLHQYVLDKIRSCDFGPMYEIDLHEIIHHNKFSTASLDRKSVYSKQNIPINVLEYVYAHREYPKLIHMYLYDHGIVGTKECVYNKSEYSDKTFSTQDIAEDKSFQRPGMFSTNTAYYTYIPYCVHMDNQYNHDFQSVHAYDTYPPYVEPKHSKQDYINYFITNDFNCNHLRKLIIELSKIMLSRREEDIIQHVKEDDVINDLQLLINYSQQLIIDCKEYLDKQMNDATVKLTF